MRDIKYDRCEKELLEVQLTYGDWPVPYDVEQVIRKKHNVELPYRFDKKCDCCGRVLL